MIKDKDFEKILESVPPDYYQNTVKKNLLARQWHKTKASFAIKLLKDISFKKCLDVGSASGYMISQIAAEYPKASFTAIDAYKEAIAYAKKKYPKINFLHGEAEKLPFKTGEFDTILCYETIEHVRNPKKTMLEMKRVLKKGGKLILAMDSGTLLFRVGWFFWGKTFARVWEGAHLNPYHHTDLENLATKSGFKIERKHFTHFGLEVVYTLEK